MSNSINNESSGYNDNDKQPQQTQVLKNERELIDNINMGIRQLNFHSLKDTLYKFRNYLNSLTGLALNDQKLRILLNYLNYSTDFNQLFHLWDLCHSVSFTFTLILRLFVYLHIYMHLTY